MKKKLFLLDAFALIYRAHFALSKSPRITSYGLNTSAAFGFVNTLLDVLQKEKPDAIAVVFDTAADTERHTDFSDYKAHREAMPEDISQNLPFIYQIVEGFGIPCLMADGYEADDVIGTLAKEAEQKGYTVYCMTPDKDYAQLVSENILLYKPARMGNDVEIMGVKEVLAKWEIERVEQVIDILGLWGDAVDNIPGIPGIGEKTAKELIKRYGSMEDIIANSHELKGKQQENVRKFAAQGLMSKKLATILLDAPVPFDEVACTRKEPSKELLEPIFTQLEFKTLGKRVFGSDFQLQSSGAPASGAQIDLFGAPVESKVIATETEEEMTPSNFSTIADTPHEYLLVDKKDAMQALATMLSKQTIICFDTETTGTDANNVDLVGLSFSIEKGKAWYIPVPDDRKKAEEIVAIFKPIWENAEISKIGHNIKYDILVLRWYDVEVAGTLHDTMLAHYLIDADARHGMDTLAQSYLNYSPVSITELIGKKGKGQGNMRDVEIEVAKEYAGEDADITLQLHHTFSPILVQNKAENIYSEVENPLVYVLAEIEKEGIKIDIDNLKNYSTILEKEILQAESSIYEKAGLKFNIASPKQLGEVLFDHLKLDAKAKKTKTGQYKTDEDVLLSLADKHEIVQFILDFRGLQKLKSTYVDALPLMINPRTGRVHSSFNQAVAATGRLSSQNPNLQNIPIKTERGREVRKAFVPRNEDFILLSADYSQIELRLIAEISQDPGMLEAFTQNLDIHTATAAKVYGVPLSEVTSTQRRNAKSVNFGIIYGQSAFGLSQSLGIPRKEAAEIIENYFSQYPNIKQYMSDTIAFAQKNGYVQTLLGRRRYLRDINSANATVRGYAERNAINAPIQGSAADLIKLAMITIHNEMKNSKLKSKMVLQVHDELVFDVHKSEVEEMSKLVKTCMQNAMPKLKVPIIAETGTGANWLEAH